MNNKLLKTSILSGFLLLSVTACGPSGPEIDGSSERSFEQSFDIVLNSLPESQRDLFVRSAEQLTMGDTGPDDFDSVDEMEEYLSWKNMEALVQENLHGKTAEEIIEEGSVLVAKSEKRELEALKARESEANKAQPVLNNITLTNPVLIKNTLGFTPEPYVEIDVENNTNEIIEGLVLKIKLHSPGRTLPWREEEEHAFFDGGIEPGEKRHASIFVSTNRDWFSDEIPADAVLEVEPITLLGLDLKSLYSIGQFDDEAKKRLAELEAKYNN